MKKVCKILLVSLLILQGLLSGSTVVDTRNADHVTVDFEMVKQGWQWLDLIRTGADEEIIKKDFMDRVAPTGGCQAIIHHWARFMEWNNETFYRFIMTALDRISTDKKIKKEDGSLTNLGKRRLLWMDALNNTAGLRQRLNELKAIDFKNNALQLARQFLPARAVLEADFYFVLFGHSNAFSVGKENGFDFLQLPMTPEGKIDVRELTRTFAHELHHTGFDSLMTQNLKEVKNKQNIQLLAILAAEGMPTYFIDQPGKHLEEFENSRNPGKRQVAADWQTHSARLQELYKEAETDIRLNLEGKKDQEALMSRWMAGMKGAAYVLGADMTGVIDKYLGREAALSIAADYRRFLILYNQAAQKAAAKGNTLLTFDPDLAKRISQYRGESRSRP
jgi:hypothetical protein